MNRDKNKRGFGSKIHSWVKDLKNLLSLMRENNSKSWGKTVPDSQTPTSR